ncbi:MAG: DUF3021 family protein [Anaerovoracaceae bacterium]
MSIREFLRKRIMEYFIITTCVTAAIAILGLALEPTARLGYEALFSPLIFGLVSLVPSLVTYSRMELTFRQTLLRKMLYVFLLEVMLLLFGFWTGILHGFADARLFVLTVLVVYLAVNLINWQFDKKDADEINKTLKSFQDRSIS